MRKSIFEEIGGIYSQVGGCLLPNLAISTHEQSSVGVWGWRHLRYIKEYRPILYNSLVLNGKLNSYLAEIGQQVREIFLRLVEQMVENEGGDRAVQSRRSDEMGQIDE